MAKKIGTLQILKDIFCNVKLILNLAVNDFKT